MLVWTDSLKFLLDLFVEKKESFKFYFVLDEFEQFCSSLFDRFRHISDLNGEYSSFHPANGHKNDIENL